MDRKQYFEDYYKANAEEKKRKRRERYHQQKGMKWGLVVLLNGKTEEEPPRIYCYKHKKNALERVRRSHRIIAKYRLVPMEGECIACKELAWRETL
jgi:hypothetical protein